ncbi:UNVERIFIED_CONTAM: hypothetical protein PYX00_003747 [Menopon gallinae]|uniref:Daxx histone-binding domain-containing protein n=1 Tax=Menopon gallinae TaxID=328185 RepID=A0AAW2I1M0_9NEOP
MATDIFMQIGNALQRRRKYDLWDSFSPFLENEIDPATTDVDLRLSLEKNFEIGVKKERELINYYAEKQDKDNLNPQEVPDEEANRSPVESGDEDEKEIEEVENTLYSHTEIENSEESEEEIYNQEKNSESHPERSADKENSDTKDSSSNVADEDEIVGSEGSTNNGMEVAEEINDENDIERFHLNETEKAVKVGSPRADSWFVVSEIRSVPLMSADAREVRNKTNNKSFHLKPWSDSDSDMSVKKRKLEETTIDSDSDCEVVIIPSDDDECDCTTKNSTNRKIHHVNYAFINSNFNHIAFSRGDNPWCKRNFRGWHRNIKKNPRRYTYPLPFRDLTNIKSITEKFARVQEEDSNRWTMKRSVVKRARLTLKRANTFFLSKSSVHCALQSNTSAKNINSASNGDRSNEKGAVEQSSGDETMDSSTGGGLGGGNGQDNNDNNDNKKPFDHENEIEDNQENDDQDEGENGEEGNDRSKLGAEQEEKGASVEENAGDVNDSCVTEEGEKEDVTSRGEDQEWEKERSPVEDAEEENNPAAEEDCQEENNASVEQNDEKPTETSEEECAGKDVSAAEEGERDSEMYKENEETNVTTTEADEEEKPEESKPEGMEESSLKPESEDVEEKSDTTKTDKADGDDTGDVPFIISEKIKAKTETNPKPKTPSKPRLQNRPSPRTKKESPAKSMRHQLGSPRRQRQVSYENYDTFSIAPGNWENFKAVKRRLYPGIPSSNSAGMAYENRISQASPSKTQKSDEEIVKNFLQHSPSSISITRTKKATAQNKPSPSVLQALETLSRLKGISTTIVKGTSKRKTDEDVTVISETLTKAANSPSKFNKSTGSFSNVQSDDCTMPRIVTVQGNVSGFESIRSNHPGSHQSKPYNRRRSSQDSNVTYGRSTISRNLAPNVHNGNTQSCPRPRGGAAGMRPRHTAPARQQKSVEYVELD